MGAPAYRLTLEDRDGYLYALMTGEQDSYETTLGATTEIAGVCKTRGITKLLVEHQISGRLSTLEIFKIASRLPDLFQGVSVAFVVHLPSVPDNPEFLQNVARNRGAQGRLFESAAEAELWLRSL